jgi:CRP/FNR family transcriptional regulator, cyclic AMP receptor protein
MSPILDVALVLERLSSLPVEIHQPGEVVLAAGGTTGKLLILKEGSVEVVREGVRLAEVSEPGAVFGELALLLGRPHTADVRALQPSTFHVAHGRTFLQANPTAALYVAVILAQRLDLVNSYLIEARSQLKPSERGGVLDRMIDNIAEALRFGLPM